MKSDNAINFLERHIIYRFGVPHRITSDNAKAFRSGKMHRFMAKYKIKWNYSTGYYPQANGMIEEGRMGRGGVGEGLWEIRV